jgi:hypothetical protein
MPPLGRKIKHVMRFHEGVVVLLTEEDSVPLVPYPPLNGSAASEQVMTAASRNGFRQQVRQTVRPGKGRVQGVTEERG